MARSNEVFGSIWNLLHAAIHRHALGRDIRRYMVCFQTHNARPSEVDDGNQIDSGRIQSWGRQAITSTSVHLGEVPDSNVTLILGEVHTHDKGPVAVFTNQSGASLTSGESSSQREATVRTESVTASAVPSRNISTRTTATTPDKERPDTDSQVDGLASVERKL